MARIRSSTRGKTDAVAAVARDIDFGHFWRQLRAVGRTAKRSSGLETEWSYVSPDGTNLFVGEDAVVVHAIESGLLDKSDGVEDDRESVEDASAVEEDVDEDVVAERQLSKGAAYENEGKVDTPDACVADEGVATGRLMRAETTDGSIRASQIYTSAQLSQHTLDALFGSSSESDVELSQTAVSRPFDLSPSELQAEQLQRDVATSLRLLSEASGVESEVEQNDVPAEPTVHVLRPRVQVKKDLNFVPEDEIMSAYESFSSDESDGGYIDEEDEDDDASDVPDDDDDTLSENDAVPMDEAFVASLQVGNDARQRADALRAMDWTSVSSAFEGGMPAYPGLNMEEAQSLFELRGLCHSPLLTFFYFMPKSLWVLINVETNRYSLQQVDRRARATQAKQGDHHRETIKQIHRCLKAKPGYQTHEILHVVGLLVVRMLCPQRRFAAHWSMTEVPQEPSLDSWVVTGAKTSYETCTL